MTGRHLQNLMKAQDAMEDSQVDKNSSEATSTVLKSIGEGLSSMARKQ
jgi:hypothetical protein